MEFNKKNATQVLDHLYKNALNGLPSQEPVYELSREYMRENDNDPYEASLSLIRWQIAKCSASGFVTGLGGLLTLPVTIPADLAVNYFVQIRMIAAIAHMHGYDVKSDKVKTMIYCCLLGDAGKDLLKNLGIQFGKKMTSAALKRLPGKVLIAINQKVGFRLVTKAGEKGLINLTKAVPLLGGFIGAGFDGYYCNEVGDFSLEVFSKRAA